MNEKKLERVATVGFSFRLVGASGFEAPATSTRDVANRSENPIDNTTQDDAQHRGLSAPDVDATLVRALDRASAACEWDTVKVIVEELRARRLQRFDVTDLSGLRARRG